MKVALLAYDYTRLGFLFGIRDLLQSKGHTVKCFTHHGSPKADVPHTAHPWGDFRFEKLEEFNPDRLVMFNGFASATLPATKLLRAKFETFHVEQGWLPQKGNIYIDGVGMGARSGIVATARRMERRKVDAFESGEVSGFLKSIYRDAGSFTPPCAGKYIVIPAQLENDTSILYDSPLFKRMSSLVAFVRKSLKDSPYNIYIKAHPRDKEHGFSYAQDLQIIREGNLNDMVAHKDCAGIVGINSTGLIEALVHSKPVVALGFNVASGSGAYQLEINSGESHEKAIARIYKELPGIFKEGVNHKKRTSVLYALSKLQFPRTSVPEWVEDLIRDGAEKEES